MGSLGGLQSQSAAAQQSMAQAAGQAGVGLSAPGGALPAPPAAGGFPGQGTVIPGAPAGQPQQASGQPSQRRRGETFLPE
jgi:hypothetical protein